MPCAELVGASPGAANHVVVGCQEYVSLALLGACRMQSVKWVEPKRECHATFVHLLGPCREKPAFIAYPQRRLESLFGHYAAQLAISVVLAVEHVNG